MELKFDSVTELDAFLSWARGYGAGPALTAELRSVAHALKQPGRICASVAPVDELQTSDESLHIAPDVAQTPEQAAADAATEGADAENPAPEGSARRKRRTKAEMQAERDAAERANGLQQPDMPAGAGTEPGAAHPEAPPAANTAVQAALSGNVAQAAAALANVPVSDNPFAGMQPAGEIAAGQVVGASVDASVSVVPPATKPTEPADIRAWLEATATGKYNAINAIEHMKLGRNFIAKLGMPKYNESFALTGLNTNIMAFSDADRALHAAALDFLDWE